MKKRIILIAVIAVLAGIGGMLGWNWYQDTYIVIDEQIYRRDITELDLRGTGLTAAEYETLCQALPECKILWSVPFQGSYWEMDLTELTLDQLTVQDIEDLALFQQLQSVDATACTDLETVMLLKEHYPKLKVTYSVPIGDASFRENTQEIVLENADPTQVENALRCLPELVSVTFNGIAPDNDTILGWMKRYPYIVFQWNFEVCGVSVSSVDTKLILNNIPMESVDEVENSLKYFHDLQLVEMCNCGITSEEMDALWKRHPETRFVWMVQVGKCQLRTDVTVFMPYQFGYNGFSKLRDEHTAELKYCVDIICMDVGHMDLSDYSFLEYMPHMQYLILADTKGEDFSVLAQLHELKFLEIFMTSFDQAEVLTGLTSLEDLNIGTSTLDNIEPLLEMTWLKRLWLPGNVNISYEERAILRNGLPDTIVWFNSVGSTGGGWREIPNYYAMRDLLNMYYSTGW